MSDTTSATAKTSKKTGRYAMQGTLSNPMLVDGQAGQYLTGSFTFNSKAKKAVVTAPAMVGRKHLAAMQALWTEGASLRVTAYFLRGVLQITGPSKPRA